MENLKINYPLKMKEQLEILLVDKSNSKDGLSSRLRKNGHHVFSTASGLETLALVERRKFSLVFLLSDSMDMGKNEILTNIRSRFTKKDMAIFYFDKECSQETVIEALEFGATEILKSPDNFQLILNKIEKHL